MRQALLLVGAFVGTLALLLGVYVALSPGSPGVAAVVTPSPSISAAPSRSPRPSPSPRVSASPSASPSASAQASVEPSPSWTPVPIMSGSPGTTPVPDSSSGTATKVTVAGRNYTAYDVQPHSTVTQLAAAAVLASTADDSQPTTIVYYLPKGSVPAGRQIARLDTTVCGSGGGNFWEVYGPDGSDPVEYEAQLPVNGCWSFTRAPGTDTGVHADVQLQSRLQIDRVTYTFWLK